MIKKLSMFLLCLVCLVGAWSPSPASADYHSNTRSFYGVNYDTSVFNTFTHNGTTYYYYDLFESARLEWHNHAPGVNLSKTTHNWADTYYVGNTSDPDLNGRVFPYNGYYDHVSMDEYWLYVKVYIYDSTFKSKNFSRAQRFGTAAHEVGHTVKMKHPADSTVDSVMHQGFAKNNNGSTSWDLKELNKKWK